MNPEKIMAQGNDAKREFDRRMKRESLPRKRDSGRDELPAGWERRKDRFRWDGRTEDDDES